METASLTSDIQLLNKTFLSKNCDGYFWFSSGSQIGLVTKVDSLGALLGALLSSVFKSCFYVLYHFFVQ